MAARRDDGAPGSCGRARDKADGSRPDYAALGGGSDRCELWDLHHSTPFVRALKSGAIGGLVLCRSGLCRCYPDIVASDSNYTKSLARILRSILCLSMLRGTNRGALWMQQ